MNDVWFNKATRGSFSGAVTVLPNGNSVYGGFDGGGTSGLVRFVDTNGNEISTDSFVAPNPATGGFSGVTGLASDSDGNVYAVGSLVRQFDRDPNNPNATSFVRKYDSNGNLLSMKFFGFYTFSLEDISFDSNSDKFLVGGQSQAGGDFTQVYDQDGFVSLLDSDGNTE